jgi:hypothetical protein
MKSLLIFALMFLSHSGFSQEWVKDAEDDKYIYYSYKNYNQKKDGIITIWTNGIYKEPLVIGNGIIEYRQAVLLNINCNNQSVRVSQVIGYDKNDNVLRNDNWDSITRNDYNFTPPGTAQFIQNRNVCERFNK